MIDFPQTPYTIRLIAYVCANTASIYQPRPVARAFHLIKLITFSLSLSLSPSFFFLSFFLSFSFFVSPALVRLFYVFVCLFLVRLSKATCWQIASLRQLCPSWPLSARGREKEDDGEVGEVGDTASHQLLWSIELYHNKLGSWRWANGRPLSWSRSGRRGDEEEEEEENDGQEEEEVERQTRKKKLIGPSL